LFLQNVNETEVLVGTFYTTEEKYARKKAAREKGAKPSAQPAAPAKPSPPSPSPAQLASPAQPSPAQPSPRQPHPPSSSTPFESEVAALAVFRQKLKKLMTEQTRLKEQQIEGIQDRQKVERERHEAEEAAAAAADGAKTAAAAAATPQPQLLLLPQGEYQPQQDGMAQEIGDLKQQQLLDDGKKARVAARRLRREARAADGAVRGREGAGGR
jgi:colicin import membrane protein